MYSDIHLQLHTLRAAELQQEAAEYARLPRPTNSPAHRLRTQLGWIMVELGLRLVHQPSVRPARIA
ncbi:hypothetical protein J7I98_20180 [Streptomyces sp. ISL-98]|uniref:hypothetical protein n=1 Tax=Streptomyces sp. ISL-98 TaxID=2819192 RepID=UPI001BE92BC4|nr:hypothetical protein [Streptomyces sp. ISL-98]MBT2508164.1 hypothetical protein [Streptomyces sp. ISL-98]